MKNNYLFILILVTLGFVFLIQVIKKREKIEYNNLKIKNENLLILNGQMDNIIRDQIMLNGKTITDWDLIDITGKSHRISDIISKRECIFYIFSEFSCMDCVKVSLDLTINNSKVLNNLILICGYTNILEVKNWISENNFQGEVYMFNDYQECIFSKSANFPYLFSLSRDLHIVNAYSISRNYDYISYYFNY